MLLMPFNILSKYILGGNILKSTHKFYFKSSQNMNQINDDSIALVITSPPYPMIEMWDDCFSKQNSNVFKLLSEENSISAFELMHEELFKTWKEVYRVLIPGGFACINIGDATRTIGKNFQLYPNHANIIKNFRDLGFSSLPEIIWRKQTNAPNKFMGSGMLPPGAYITLEHEYILIFRKGKKRSFDEGLKALRQESAYFWEERNKWFSDLWEIKGTAQFLQNKHSRERSAAYPIDIPFRLINMFSIKSDFVLDPFIGTGTTSLAAIASNRNSIGFEIDENFKGIIEENIMNSIPLGNQIIKERILNHIGFINLKRKEQDSFKYFNINYNFPVITNQELNLRLDFLKKCIKISDSDYEIEYEDNIPSEFVYNGKEMQSKDILKWT